MTIAVEQPSRVQTDRIFFTSMAIAAAFTVFAGFWPTYFLRVSTLPALTPLYHVHGAVFMTWIILFVTQTALVAGRRTDIHRRLGVAGAVVAGAVFILGVTVSIEALRRGGGSQLADPRSFLSIPLADIIVFGVLVTAAVAFRLRSDWHKRLMLLATISVLTAAVARFLAQIHAGGPLGLFLGTDIFVAALVLYDFASLGRVHLATIWGGAMVVVFKPLLFAASSTALWLASADALR
jgi:hypothetical protein